MAKGKSKLPKTILGVPVPKELRRLGGLESVLSSPAVKKLLADALIAAAAAAAASLTQTRPSAERNGQSDEGSPDGAGRPVAKLQDGGGAVGTVLSEVARSILPGEGQKAGKGKAGKGRKKQRDAERVHH